jgi:acetyl-CoA carboxylase biotin carboxyl carrier protein
MTDKLSVDDDLIRRLAELLEETGLSEIEIGEGEQHLRVARPSPGAVVTAAPLAVLPTPVEDAASPSEAAIDATHPGAVVSPMVGTIYLSPEPGSPPFISQGSSVSEGDTLFIIEAMKTMNPVRAPRGGSVSKILVENESPVEFGDVLAILG